MKTNTATRTSIFAASILAGAISLGLGTSASADDILQPAADNNAQAFAALSASVIPDFGNDGPGTDVNTMADNTGTAMDFLQNLGNLSFAGISANLSTRTSTRTLHKAASDLYETAMARCEHWRDNAAAGASGNHPNSRSDVRARIDQILTGSRQAQASGYQTSDPVTRSDFNDMQDELALLINDLGSAMNSVDTAPLDPGVRISTRTVKAVLDEFSAAVNTVCPAE